MILLTISTSKSFAHFRIPGATNGDEAAQKTCSKSVSPCSNSISPFLRDGIDKRRLTGLHLGDSPTQRGRNIVGPVDRPLRIPAHGACQAGNIRAGSIQAQPDMRTLHWG